MQLAEKTCLVIIDPQNDFMDQPGAALPVPGAKKDMERLTAFVRDHGDHLGQIHVTLDSHHPIHIAHPNMWVDAATGAAPRPFTAISHEDIVAGKYRSASSKLSWMQYEYVRRLEERGRYKLTIWPPHCLIGSPGHNIETVLFEALVEWELKTNKTVNYVHKGSFWRTEHYSAISAEIPDEFEASTNINFDLINEIFSAEQIFVAGEALSHCVASTLRDFANLRESQMKTVYLLSDCTSSVSGFESLAETALEELYQSGLTPISSISV